MALVTLVDVEGKEILIHTSQIGRPAPLPLSVVQWSEVWGRLDETLTALKKDERA